VVDPIKGSRGWFISKKEKVMLLKEEKTDTERVATKDKISAISDEKLKKSRFSVGVGLWAVSLVLSTILIGSLFFVVSNSIKNRDKEIAQLQSELLLSRYSMPTFEKFLPANGSDKSSLLLKYTFEVTNEKNLEEVAQKIFGSVDGVKNILESNPTINLETALKPGLFLEIPVQATLSLPSQNIDKGQKPDSQSPTNSSDNSPATKSNKK
jgi:flagellar basal body-associated protein FliL